MNQLVVSRVHGWALGAVLVPTLLLVMLPGSVRAVELDDEILFVGATADYPYAEVEVVVPDGSDRHTVIRGPGHVTSRWSPDGALVAAIRLSDDGSPALHFGPAEPSSGDQMFPNISAFSWAPDGSRLAGIERPDGWGSPSSNLVIVDAWNGGVTPVATLGDAANAVAWSPDGTRIVVTDGDVGESRIYRHLVSYTPEGGDRQEVTPFTTNVVDSEPAWSPDGSRLLFHRNDGDEQSRLMVTDALGGSPVTLAQLDVGSDGVLQGSWSPNSQQVVVASGYRTCCAVEEAELFLVGADATGRSQIFPPRDDTIDTNPVFSPDGQSIAFIRSYPAEASGSADPAELRLVEADGSDDRVVTTNVGDTSPDFRPQDLEPTPMPSPTGEPATVQRVGADVEAAPVPLANHLCRLIAPENDSANSVLLSRADEFADALAGAALAGDDACILYTDGGPDRTLDQATRLEIHRALPAGGTVYVLGGPNAVSSAVEQELRDAGYDVQRVAGETRFETAADVARIVLGRTGGDRALLAFGFNWADAVTGGAYGARTGVPVLLSNTNELHPSVQAVIQEFGLADVPVLGGTAVISDAVRQQLPGAQERFAGANRMGTAAAIVRQLWRTDLSGPVRLTVVNLGNYGSEQQYEAWTLALAAAPYAARFDAPQVGVFTDSYPGETQELLEALGDDPRIDLVGGEEVINEAVASQVAGSVGQ